MRKNSVRLLDSDPIARSKKYLRYAKKKTKEITDMINDTVLNCDPYVDIEEIEESKQSLVSRQEYLDADLQRDLDSFTEGLLCTNIIFIQISVTSSHPLVARLFLESLLG